MEKSYNSHFKASLYYGLCHLLEYLTIFKNNPNIMFDIQFSDDEIKSLRPEYDKTYYERFQKFLLPAISKMDNVNLCDGNTFPYISPVSICQDLNIPCNSMEFYTLDSIDTEYENYVVMNTKCVTGVDGGIRDLWQSRVKDGLANVFNKYDTTVILIGEAQYSDCHEYKLHNTFSLYSDIISSNIKNLIDLTSKNTIDLYTIEILTRNMSILKKSNFNIHIGEGGGIKVFAYNNKLLAYTNYSLPFLLYTKNHELTQSFDPQTFVSQVETNLTHSKLI